MSPHDWPANLPYMIGPSCGLIWLAHHVTSCDWPVMSSHIFHTVCQISWQSFCVCVRRGVWNQSCRVQFQGAYVIQLIYTLWRAHCFRWMSHVFRLSLGRLKMSHSTQSPSYCRQSSLTSNFQRNAVFHVTTPSHHKVDCIDTKCAANTYLTIWVVMQIIISRNMSSASSSVCVLYAMVSAQH